MSVNPAIRACQNEYTRWWYNGFLVGVLSGVAVACGVVAGVWSLGKLWY